MEEEGGGGGEQTSSLFRSSIRILTASENISTCWSEWGWRGRGILICGNIEKRRGCVKLRFRKETGKEEIRRNMEKEK
jgi:hypothetical protein